MRKQSIETAVILAAGLGSRLRNVFADKPKGLFTIGDISLVARSINLLIESGIQEVIIVTGYLAEEYDALAQSYPGVVRTIFNPHFANSDSMYSLYCARHALRDSFLLLESDLIYEKRALSTLLESEAASAILISGLTHSGDEVYIESSHGTLVQMSKNQHELAHIDGVLVGISKISSELFAKMIHSARHYFEKCLDWSYEDGCLSQLAKESHIPICLVPDLLWAEIDNEEHLRYVQEVVWPQITRQE